MSLPADFADYIARVVAEAPPLSNAQRDSLALLLRGEKTQQAARAPRRPRPVEQVTKVYRHYDKCGCLLYIGVSCDPVKRAYAHGGSSWWSRWAVRMDTDEAVYSDRDAALSAERDLIQTERPIFNTVHASDKRTAIIRYLIRHERWEHLSVASALDPAEKPEVLRMLDRASLFDGVMWHEEPIEHVVDYQDPEVRRFLDQTEVDAHGCWRWQGRYTATGYPTFRQEGHTRMARRVAYALFTGPIPDENDVRQRCEAKDCVNPSHLRAVPKDARRRTVMGRTDLCERNHPGSPTRWGKRGDGRDYCRECHRVQTRRRRCPTGDI